MKLTSSCLSSSMKYIYCYYSGAIDLNKSNASMFSDDEGEISSINFLSLYVIFCNCYRIW